MGKIILDLCDTRPSARLLRSSQLGFSGGEDLTGLCTHAFRRGGHSGRQDKTIVKGPSTWPSSMHNALHALTKLETKTGELRKDHAAVSDRATSTNGAPRRRKAVKVGLGLVKIS